MKLTDLSDEQLETMAQNYRAAKKTVGGKFSYAEVLLELGRRSNAAYGGRAVLEAILQLCRSSPSKKTTYGDLYFALSKGSPWKGNATQGLMSKTLDKAAHYCIVNNLPMITALVVRATGKLDPSAIKNMYNFAKERGIDVGISPDGYIEREIREALRFVENQASLLD